MSAQSFQRVISRFHKLAGVTVGLQILLWVLGGFVMSWFEIEKVRGEHLVSRSHDVAVPASMYDFGALQMALEGTTDKVAAVSTHTLYGTPVFRIEDQAGRVSYLDSQTAAPLEAFSADDIERFALRSYLGSGSIARIELMNTAGIEYRGKLPVWKVDFADDDNTSVYFDPNTARITAVRTDLWRFYDFMWMLHIMDYDTRDDFNHPLLYLMALAAVVFVLTGFILARFRLRKRDFKLP